MKRQCERCHAWFESKHVAHVLCSDRCAHGRWLDRGRRPADPVVVPCACCQQPFLRINPKRRYCSYTCRSRTTANRHQKNARDRIRQREWARAHREDNNRRSRDWARANPARARSKAQARRAKERGAGGRWTEKDWQELVRRYRGRCAYCGCAAKLTVDHRQSLRRGGSNSANNILPACGWCNRSKGARDEKAFRKALRADGCGHSRTNRSRVGVRSMTVSARQAATINAPAFSLAS
jgi:hypothetical protein